MYTQPACFCIPPDEIEMPEEYLQQARASLLADLDWIAEQIAEAICGADAEMLMSGKDRFLCDRLRSVVRNAIDAEQTDLAESLWNADIESSLADAAEHERGDLP